MIRFRFREHAATDFLNPLCPIQHLLELRQPIAIVHLVHAEGLYKKAASTGSSSRFLSGKEYSSFEALLVAMIHYEDLSVDLIRGST